MTHIITGVKREADMEVTYGNSGLVLNHTEHYHVLADSKTATKLDVYSNAVAENTDVADLLGTIGGESTGKLPVPRYTVDIDGLSVCKTVNGVRDQGNPLKWTFTAKFSSEVKEGSSPMTDLDVPLEDAIPIRETLYEPVTRVRTRDLVGRTYLNGARNAYAPPLQVDDELPRWDFAQFDLDYGGPLLGAATSYAALSGTGFAWLTTYDSTSTPGTIWPPGTYVNNGGGWAFYAPNDATVHYFNGCVNQFPFLGFPAYTLLLKVRSSRVGIYQGQRKRLTEFSIIYDRENHWDKPPNAGPFFLAPKLNDDGDAVSDTWVQYPYIYYRGDTENEHTDLAIDQNGPLGNRDIVISYNNTTGRMEAPTLSHTDGFPLAGYTKIRLPGSVEKYTYRANRPSPTAEYYSIEYVNHDLLNFGAFLRVQ